MATQGKLARQLSRELRKNPTPAESKLWSKLKNRQFLNLRFLRQHPIYYQYDNQRNFFIADFYCHQLKIIIEIDGRIHDQQKDYDVVRTELLKFKNMAVIRFRNEEILQNIENVQEILKKFIKMRQNKNLSQ